MGNVTFADIAVGIGAAGTMGAIIVWWVSRILDLRKEIIQLQMKVEFQEKEIKELRKDMDKFEGWYNGRND